MENLEELTKIVKESEQIVKTVLKEENILYDLLEVRIYDAKSVGVVGDDRNYGYILEINLKNKGNNIWGEKLLQNISNKITNEVFGTSRVVYVIN